VTRTILVSALSSVFLFAQDPQRPVFRTGVQTVPVYVTVTDKSGRLVTDLTKDDFEIRDNGKPQEITLFENKPQAIRLIVMLDVSGSMEGNLPILRTAANELFNRLRADDQVRIGTFGDEVELSPTFTNDPQILRAALPTDIRGGNTPLWEGIDKAMTAFGDMDGRRVVLVLSDGGNTNRIGFGRIYVADEIIERAERENFLVYAIGMQPGRTMELLSQPDPQLGEVAIQSGGGYTEIRRRDDLGAAFARIADELHRQYLIGFAPTSLDGKMHKIEVRMKNGDLKPRARKSYLAPKR
jgi:Ca-activated chloride channel family protein